MTTDLSDEQLECLRGCSLYFQYYEGRKAFETGVCPFCVIDPSTNHVIYDKNGWIAWEVPQNLTTRQATLSLQLVFFPARHVRNPTELTQDERLGYFDVIDWAHEKFAIPGGGIINRIGNMRYNVGTIMHMHATIMVPNCTNEVILPLQKTPELWHEHDCRMNEFARRYEAGEIP